MDSEFWSLALILLFGGWALWVTRPRDVVHHIHLAITERNRELTTSSPDDDEDDDWDEDLADDEDDDDWDVEEDEDEEEAKHKVKAA